MWKFRKHVTRLWPVSKVSSSRWSRSLGARRNWVEAISFCPFYTAVNITLERRPWPSPWVQGLHPRNIDSAPCELSLVLSIVVDSSIYRAEYPFDLILSSLSIVCPRSILVLHKFPPLESMLCQQQSTHCPENISPQNITISSKTINY